MLRLFLHPRHELIAVHAFGEAWEVFDNAGRGEQATGLFAGDNERPQIRAGRVQGGRPTGATGSNDDNFFHNDDNLSVVRRSSRPSTSARVTQQVVNHATATSGILRDPGQNSADGRGRSVRKNFTH